MNILISYLQYHENNNNNIRNNFDRIKTMQLLPLYGNISERNFRFWKQEEKFAQ